MLVKIYFNIISKLIQNRIKYEIKLEKNQLNNSCSKY